MSAERRIWSAVEVEGADLGTFEIRRHRVPVGRLYIDPWSIPSEGGPSLALAAIRLMVQDAVNVWCYPRVADRVFSAVDEIEEGEE